jgi:hypothetical protein
LRLLMQIRCTCAPGARKEPGHYWCSELAWNKSAESWSSSTNQQAESREALCGPYWNSPGHKPRHHPRGDLQAPFPQVLCLPRFSMRWSPPRSCRGPRQ